MFRFLRAIAFGLAITGTAAGCYGPFNLTRRLHDWNGREGYDRWEEEFLFVLLTWAPVYGLTVVADAILFNSLEFWTGTNPVQPPSGAPLKSLQSMRRLDQGGELVRFATAPDGGIAVLDADGRLVAYYSATQVQQAMALVAQTP